MSPSLPLVLIHGFPLDASMWSAQKAALEGAGHRVFTPDLPGFGAAPAWPKDCCSLEAFAETIHELIQKQIGEPAVVGGLSMGGYITLALLRAHPESVRAALLLDTRADADAPEARAARLRAIEDVTAHGSVALIETMLGRVLSKHVSDALRQEVRALMARQSIEGIIGAQWAMARRRDQSDLLPTLKIPVLIVVGADDVSTPASVAFGMQSRLPRATLAQIARAGHLSNLEAPEPVTTTILNFLQSL